MRFHLDEHIDPAVALGLRMRDIDVTTTADAGLTSAADTEHVAFAARERRIIVTNDADFLALHQQGVNHCGIVYVPRASLRVGEMVRGIVLVNASLSEAEMQQHVEFLPPDA